MLGPATSSHIQSILQPRRKRDFFCQHIIYATRPLCRPIITTRPFYKPIMTSTPFDVDNYMPDWDEDFDFGAFLNLPADEDDQGVMTGLVFFFIG